jgi:hypothetical protein
LIFISIMASVCINVGVFLLLFRVSTTQSIATVVPTGGSTIVESKKPLENKREPLTENKTAEIAVPIKNQDLVPIKVELLIREGLINYDRGFIVTCLREDGIHVDKVVYNRTYEAKIVMFPNRGVGPMFVSNSRFPVELEIGESIPILWQFGEPMGTGRTASSYGRDIVFLDVHTDRGTFRFDPNGKSLGSVVPKPGVDTKRLTEREDSNRAAEFKAAQDAKNNAAWKPPQFGLKPDKEAMKAVDDFNQRQAEVRRQMGKQFDPRSKLKGFQPPS